MKKSWKQVLSVFLIGALSFGIYLYLGMVVTPKDVDDTGAAIYYNGMGFLAEPADSLDVMVYGNSDVYSGFSPAVLNEKFGLTAYASGRARQSMSNVVGLLRRALKRQHPRLIILETDCFFTRPRKDLSVFTPLVAPFLFHARWKDLKMRDFCRFPSRRSRIDPNRGYIDSDLVFPAERNENYMYDGGTEKEAIPEKSREYVETFVDLCKKQGIPVLFLELPSPASWNGAKHRAVGELAESLEIPFLDMNLPCQGYELDSCCDFRDNGDHLNHRGAEKATEYIGTYIRKNYPDAEAEAGRVSLS